MIALSKGRLNYEYNVINTISLENMSHCHVCIYIYVCVLLILQNILSHFLFLQMQHENTSDSVYSQVYDHIIYLKCKSRFVCMLTFQDLTYFKDKCLQYILTRIPWEVNT